MSASTLNKVLWALQGLLGGVFIFAGAIKLLLPIHDIAAQTGVSGGLLRFVAVCEVLGALGLLLPGRLKFGKVLTPLAAAGLVLIMCGAVVVSMNTGGIKTALFPFAVGLWAAFIGWGRLKVRG